MHACSGQGETNKGMPLTKEIMINAICAASEEVFSTMLGVQVAYGPVYAQQGSVSGSDGVIALIGIAGSWIGTGTITCAPAFACRISSLLLMTEYQSVDNDVLDALAEIANMIFGNAKTVLEEHVGPLGLSVPTVIMCKDFNTKQTASELWTGIPLFAEGMQMDLRLGLTPNRGSSAGARHAFDHKFGVLAHR